MNRETLIASAKKIAPFSRETVDEYFKKRELLVSLINSAIEERQNIEQLVGVSNIEMMKDNHRNHSRFVLSIISRFDVEILVDTVLWVFRAYKSHGFSDNYWVVQLNLWVEILEKELSEKSFKELYQLYDWFIVNIPLFTQVSSQQSSTGEEPRH